MATSVGRPFNGKGVVIVKSTEQAVPYPVRELRPLAVRPSQPLYRWKGPSRTRTVIGVEPVRQRDNIWEKNPTLPSKVNV